MDTCPDRFYPHLPLPDGFHTKWLILVAEDVLQSRAPPVPSCPVPSRLVSLIVGLGSNLFHPVIILSTLLPPLAYRLVSLIMGLELFVKFVGPKLSGLATQVSAGRGNACKLLRGQGMIPFSIPHSGMRASRFSAGQTRTPTACQPAYPHPCPHPYILAVTKKLRR